MNAATQIYRNFEKVRKIKKTKNRKKLAKLIQPNCLSKEPQKDMTGLIDQKTETKKNNNKTEGQNQYFFKNPQIILITPPLSLMSKYLTRDKKIKPIKRILNNTILKN